jgi:Asp/Glu/hydantoin racemase
MPTRITLIHATTVSIDPIHQTFRRSWPEAELVNLLDDSLSIDRASDGTLTAQMSLRIKSLAEYGQGLGSKAILFTCSAFGPAIESAARISKIPVLKPNEAMFETAIGLGKNIGMVATFAPALQTMVQEFEQDVDRLNADAKLEVRLASGAIEALRAGDAETHNRLVSEEVSKLSHCDTVMLAHFSTSRAAEMARRKVSIPVITSPEAAVQKLRKLLLSS